MSRSNYDYSEFFTRALMCFYTLILVWSLSVMQTAIEDEIKENRTEFRKEIQELKVQIQELKDDKTE